MLKRTGTGSPDRLTNEQLLARADRLLEAAPENMDIEAFETCLAELQERAPVMVEYDPAGTEKRLRKEHPEVFAPAVSLWKRGRTARRAVLIAAVLTVLLAAGSMAGGLFGDWSVYFDVDENGIRRVVSETTYGGGMLPGGTRRRIVQALDTFVYDGKPRAHYTFADYTEMEDFLGLELVGCEGMTAGAASCDGRYASKNGDDLSSYPDLLVSGSYTLSDGENALWCSFSFTTQKNTPVSSWSSAEGENIHFYPYELKQFGVTASIAAGMGDGQRSDVFFVKNNIAYRITSTADKNTLCALLDNLK